MPGTAESIENCRFANATLLMTHPAAALRSPGKRRPSATAMSGRSSIIRFAQASNVPENEMLAASLIPSKVVPGVTYNLNA
jgi:hypothetical protein